MWRWRGFLGVPIWIGATTIALVHFSGADDGKIPPPFFVYCSLVSIVSCWTLIRYVVDKNRAEKGRSDARIPESDLHFLEWIGGWPGALVGQGFWRHKNRKLSYQLYFAFIVMVHIFIVGPSCWNHERALVTARDLWTTVTSKLPHEDSGKILSATEKSVDQVQTLLTKRLAELAVAEQGGAVFMVTSHSLPDLRTDLEGARLELSAARTSLSQFCQGTSKSCEDDVLKAKQIQAWAQTTIAKYQHWPPDTGGKPLNPGPKPPFLPGDVVDPATSPANLVMSAEEALSRRDLPTAQSLFEQVLQMEPPSASQGGAGVRNDRARNGLGKVRFLLGEDLSENGNYQRAIEHYSKALAMSRENEAAIAEAIKVAEHRRQTVLRIALVAEADGKLTSGDIHGADAIYSQVLSQDPGNKSALDGKQKVREHNDAIEKVRKQ